MFVPLQRNINVNCMYKEIDLNDKSLFENSLTSVEPSGNMTLEEAYDFVMDKVRAVYDMKDAV